MAAATNTSRTHPEAIGLGELISIKQLAERLGVTPRSVERYIARGELPEPRNNIRREIFQAAADLEMAWGGVLGTAAKGPDMN